MRITDQILNRYLEIQDEIKMLELELKMTKDEIVKNNGALTSNHVAVIKMQSRQSVAGKKAFDEKFGHGWLEKNEMINTITFPMVVVTKKAA